MGNGFIVSKQEKAFVNYAIDAGLLDKEEVRRICIAKKRLKSTGKTKEEANLVQLAISANYLTEKQARAILKEIKQERQEAGQQEYEKEIKNTLEVYGINLEKLVMEQKKDYSAPEERYARIEEIGRGGMGIVDNVWDNILNREVARKTILLTEKAKGDPKRLQEDLIRKTQRAKNEARLTGRLRHPFIMKVHDSGRDAENNFFYVMELVEKGRELTEVIDEIAEIRRKGKMLPERYALENVLEMVAQVCDGVDYAHEQKIIHRDLKPENIMVYGSADKLFMYVVDWGLAKDLNKRELVLKGELDKEDLKAKLEEAKLGKTQEIETQEGQVMGTLKYMAPEQAVNAKDADEKADIFSLGAILYEVLTGQTARDLQGKNLMQMLYSISHKEIDDAREAKAPLYKITKELAAICAKAMHLDPEKRYKSAGCMAKDIRNFLEHKEVTASPDGFFKKLYKKALRNPLKAGMLATASVLIPLAIGGVGVVKGISAQNELKLEATARQEAEKRAETEAERADLAEKLKNINEKQRRALELNMEGLMIEKKSDLLKKAERKEQLETAIQKYLTALEIYPDFAAAYNNLGNANKKLGNIEQAIKQYNRALELDPDLAVAYNNRALVNAAKGELEEAEKDFTEAIERLPLYVEAYVGRSVVHIRQGDYQEAIADCEKALEIKPKDTLAHWNKGESHMYLGEYRAAEESFSNAVTWGDVSARLMIARNMLNAAESGRPLYENWRERAREQIEKAARDDESLAKEAQELLEKIK